MILKLTTSTGSDLTRQAGFIVTIYDEDGLRLASTLREKAPPGGAPATTVAVSPIHPCHRSM
jgi:hypothetical protein